LRVYDDVSHGLGTPQAPRPLPPSQYPTEVSEHGQAGSCLARLGHTIKDASG
jgi:hypothetical protein